MSNGKKSTKSKSKKPAAKKPASVAASVAVAPVVEPPPRKKKPVVENEHYAIKEWHEREMFQCKHCPWSTLDEDEMVRHIADHLKLPSVKRTDTGFVTPTGAKIIREEIVEEDKEV